MLLFALDGLIHASGSNWIIETLARVRSRLPEVRLHIVSPAEILPGTKQYRHSVCSLIRANAEWVDWHEDLPRKELIALLSRTRYGIHAHTKEHFGIAVAEMVLARSIPFVYECGGPAEIVGADSRLTYRSTDDAVEKISALMTDSAAQVSLRAALALREQLFSTNSFMRTIRSLVARELATHAETD